MNENKKNMKEKGRIYETFQICIWDACVIGGRDLKNEYDLVRKMADVLVGRQYFGKCSI
jgi:hypothetical protein